MARTAGRLWSRALDALSFSAELRRLRRELNALIDAPSAIGIGRRPPALAGARWSPGRRVSIAEAYVRVVTDLDSRHAKLRLRALRRIVALSFHAKTLDMPLNTARVQLALVKEAVKSRGDRRRQLELLHDFSESSYGQHQLIRRLLAERGMIEVPENGLPLSALDAGRDDNVHDSSTSGRKNATQLLIDAFIKGISELTIACAGESAIAEMREAIEAGRIVGIRVRLGIEFSLAREGKRFHFMAVLPTMDRGMEIRRFFAENRRSLRELLAGLEENQAIRLEAIRHSFRTFNSTRRDLLDESFPRSPSYRLPRLRMRDLAKFAPLERVTRSHLGDFMFSRFEPVYRNRVLYLMTLRGRAERDAAEGRIAESTRRAAEERYLRARAEYSTLSPDRLRRELLSDPAAEDYSTVFDDLPRLSRELRDAGCRLRLLHPLEHGRAMGLAFMEDARFLIDEIEVYNVMACAEDGEEDIRALCEAVNAFNAKAAGSGLSPLVPLCGSDATGRGEGLPGMGFVFADRIGGSLRVQRRYAALHRALPRPVAALVRGGGEAVDLDGPAPVLYSMGKIAGPRQNRLGDEADEPTGPLNPRRILRYLNPGLVDVTMIVAGFVIARAVVGEGYALLWLGITGFRVAVADIIASRGVRFREWRLASVNFGNVARALFWTGLSVPVLGAVKSGFDSLWPFAAAGLAFEGAKFFFISGVNSLYIATHNTIRGFDRSVIKANLLRSFLAWPFATAFAPVGNLLGLPSIVQAKIWSDTVGGFIEGGAKYFKTVRLRRRDLEEILPRLDSPSKGERFPAILDLLWLWREEPRSRDSLAVMLAGSPESIAARIALPKTPTPARQTTAARTIPEAASRGAATPSATPSPTSPASPASPKPVADKDAARRLDLLARPDLDRKLLDFVIEEYPKEVAAGLARLIAETLPPFSDWLAERVRKT